MLRKQSINDAQSATVDLHFSELIDDISVIDETHREFTKDDLPEWFDKKLFKAGQDYYCRNLLGSGMSAMCGLLAVLIIPSILRVLIWTKKSGTPCTAFSRYLETLLHTYYLFASDIDDPNSRFWKSINEIRYMHSTSSRKSRNAGIGGITQRDMALTQFGFMGYALIAPEKLALTNEKHEREGLNHFWRIVGHAIGISDRLNICRKNEVETTELCRRLNKEVFGPHMKNRPVNFPEMAGAMLDGMWCVDPVLNYDSFMSFWYDLSGLSYDKPLGLVSRVNSAYRACILYLMGK
uniref:Mb1430_0 protein n=1 Tax=Fopius arisanus TaxID=64838 RepID=A0A0C9PRD0_9HYME